MAKIKILYNFFNGFPYVPLSNLPSNHAFQLKKDFKIYFNVMHI